MSWEFDICKTFECSETMCKKRTGRDCGARFWEPTCINFEDHENLNLNKSTYRPARMAETFRSMDAGEYGRLHKPLGK